MLKDNIRILRKQKGLSQEELSLKLNVVRQTISKWEKGISVPDSEMLISISKEFDTPVSTLLGENIEEKESDALKRIAEKLEFVNFELAKEKDRKRKIWHWFFIILSILIALIFIGIITLGNRYLDWNYKDPELAILGVGIHYFIWIFVRIAPIIFIGSIVGICLTRKKQ